MLCALKKSRPVDTCCQQPFLYKLLEMEPPHCHPELPSATCWHSAAVSSSMSFSAQVPPLLSL